MMRSGRDDLDEPLEPKHLLEDNNQQQIEQQVENARGDGPQTSLPPSLKDRVLLSLPLLSSFYFLGSFIALMGPCVPTYARITERPETDYGGVFTSRGIGYILGAIVSSRCANAFSKYLGIRPSRLTILGTSTLALGAVGLVLAYSTSFYEIVCVVLIQGFCCGSLDSQANLLIMEIHQELVSPWMHTLHFSFSFGALVAPFVLGREGLANTLAGFGIAVLPFGVFAIFIALSPTAKISGGAKIVVEEASDGLRKEEGEDDGEPEVAGSVPVLKESAITESLLYIFMFIYVGAEVGCAGWTPAIAVSYGASEELAAYTSSIFWLGITIGRLIAIPSAHYLTTGTMLEFCLLGSLIGGIASSLWGYTYPGLVVGTAVYGIFMSAIYPLSLNLPQALGFKVSDRFISGTVFGASLGEMLIPLATGVGIDGLGAGAFFFMLVSAPLVLGCLYCIIILYAKRKARTVGEVQFQPMKLEPQTPMKEEISRDVPLFSVLGAH